MNTRRLARGVQRVLKGAQRQVSTAHIREGEAEARRRLEDAFNARDDEQRQRLAFATKVATGEELPQSVRDAVFTPVSEAFPASDTERLRNPPRDDVIQPTDPRALRVAVLGLANSGKSSLMNNLVGDHISAVSTREGCTQKWTRGISSLGGTQLIFMDTPPVYAMPALQSAERKGPLREFGLLRRLRSTQAGWDAIHGADAVLVAVDSSWGTVEGRVISMLKMLKRRLETLDREVPVFVALTRTDIFKKRLNATPVDIAVFADAFAEASPIELATSPIRVSNKDADSLLHLRRMLSLKALPAEWQFPSEQKTDLSLPERVEESLREKASKLMQWENGNTGNAADLTRFSVVGWTAHDNGSVSLDCLAFFGAQALLREFRKNLKVFCDKASVSIERTLGHSVRLNIHCAVDPRGYAGWELPNPYRFYGEDLTRHLNLDLLVRHKDPDGE
eukprot:Hpha_TRINITY_DN26854_c0_g1::TRINITY_DN26854_c0_g1_i1::g.17237::m.17237/K03595/era, ERAL1; GTPase